MIEDLNDKLDLFLLELNNVTDFHFEYYSRPFLIRRINARINRLKIETLKEYLVLLKSDKQEIHKLLNELSIHVTHFFRDREMYEVLMLETLFGLIKQKEDKGIKSIKIWSAGCSSGEETYSIGITILELLGNRINDFNVDIIGTDIDLNAINESNKGHYKKEQLKETDASLIEKYFRENNDFYEINSSVKSIVSFKQGDILSPLKPRELDVIFCRNVVIYFSREIKEKLYEDFYKSLNPGGILVIGKTESLIGSSRDKFKLVNMSDRIFIKPTET